MNRGKQREFREEELAVGQGWGSLRDALWRSRRFRLFVTRSAAFSVLGCVGGERDELRRLHKARALVGKPGCLQVTVTGPGQ